MSRSVNGCVVLTGPLTVAVRCFLDRWNAERPSQGGGAGGGTHVEVELVRAVEWLTMESGVPEGTIHHIRNGRYRTTELSVADQLVQALGHPEWFYDGTLTIIPNPSAPRALREECCGSLEQTAEKLGAVASSVAA